MKEKSDSIGHVLQSWDGKDTGLLKSLYDQHRDKDGFVNSLLIHILSPDDGTTVAASWLLKAVSEKNGPLTTAQTDRLVDLLLEVGHPDTQLHLCQTIRHLELTEKQADKVVEGLKPLHAHTRPFVRAWSMDALVSIAKRHSKYSAAATAVLKAASQDPAASVKARARNLAVS